MLKLGEIIVAGLLATAGIAAVPSDGGDPVLAALDRADFKDAAEQIDRLAQLRDHNAARLDLDYGSYFAATGLPIFAQPYLLRALNVATGAERDRQSLKLARVAESGGDVAAAQVRYASLSADAGDPVVKAEATVDLARLRLAADPEGALTLLQPLVAKDGDPSVAWEAALLLSRAMAQLGRGDQAQAALAQAWTSAPLARHPDQAIAVTAGDMAVDRIAAGDRTAGVALASLRAGWTPFRGTPQLPICDADLRPDDWVIVAITRRDQRPLYAVVRSSRPGIGMRFTVPLGIANQPSPVQPIFARLRCRSTPTSGTRIPVTLTSLPRWLAERGVYPPLGSIDANEANPLAAWRQRLRMLEAQPGGDPLRLIPLRLQVALLTASQGNSASPADMAEAQAAVDRAIKALIDAGAPVLVIEEAKLGAAVAQGQSQALADLAVASAERAFDDVAQRPRSSPEEMLATIGRVSLWRLRPAQRLALLDRLIAILNARGVPPTDPSRRSATLERIAVLRDLGTIAPIASDAAVISANDLCAAADRVPSIPPNAITITSDDYPKDLLQATVAGLTAMEFDVDPTGGIARPRLVVSTPPDLFDATTQAKLRPVRLLPATRSGQPTGCRGYLQTVRWQIPETGDSADMWGALAAIAERGN